MSNANGLITVDGGTLTIADDLTLGTNSDTSTFTQNGGTVNVGGLMTISQVAANTGTYNLNGGALVIGGLLDLVNLGTDTF